ncbi:MAG: orotate phosphoribosyltransferase [Gemmatimonadota bacterium]
MSEGHTGVAALTQLVAMLARRSSRRGEFTLSSGRKSDFYIDARLTTMSADGLALIGQLGLDRIRDKFHAATALGGLTLGADPIAYAISLVSASTSRPLNAFTVRKEPKTHGTGRSVEGPLEAGDVAVIVEDVITTGESALRAVSAVRDHGAAVAGILALVDREEGGRERIEQQGLAVVSLATRRQIAVLL